MPIPGDNGNPEREKAAQEQRITDVAMKGGEVKPELRFNKPEPKKNSIFGKVS